MIFVVVKLIFPSSAGWRPVGSSGQCQAGAGIGRPGPRCPVRCPIPGQVPTVSAAPIGPDAGSLAADWLAPVSSPHAITHLDPHFGLMALYPRLFLQRRTSFNLTRGSQALACAYEIWRFRLHLCITTSTCIQHKLKMYPVTLSPAKTGKMYPDSNPNLEGLLCHQPKVVKFSPSQLHHNDFEATLILSI